MKEKDQWTQKVSRGQKKLIGWKAFKTFKDYIVLFSNGFQVCGGSMRRKYKEKVWGGFLRKVWVGLIKDFEKGKEK